MCGIVGYIGASEASPVLLDGLRRLEYRGYDSAGLAVLGKQGIVTRKTVGRIANLDKLLETQGVTGTVGISHTRWATHGGVTDANAHPHQDARGKLALVHNGVIENYLPLREELEAEGHVFLSETDSEVLAHLIGKYYDALELPAGKDRLVQALRKALTRINGTYGIVLMHEEVPGILAGARRGSPLVVGIGRHENFLASDVGAIVAYTRDAIYLDDYDIVLVDAETCEVSAGAGQEVERAVSRVEYTEEDVSLGAYPHYMLKEIFEQPDALRNALRGRLARNEATVQLGGLNMSPTELRQVNRIILTGCGSALHAARVGECLIESLAHIPVEVEYASEFRYRNVPTDNQTLVFAISQSGETADTLAALRESRRKGLKTLGICNNVASTIARESDGGIYMHAGPEIGVAATKSFTSQVLVMALLGVLFGRMRYLSNSDGKNLLDALEQLPEKVEQILKNASEIDRIAGRLVDASGVLFLGRLSHFPVALEGALKMKEITYLHAEGHPSSELKHGVIALISEKLPSVVIAPDDAVLGKNMSTIEEIKARKGPVIAIATEGNQEIYKVADEVITIPECLPILSSILTTIPLQLLAYYTAVRLGRDVDKPRNLAKSVTVE